MLVSCALATAACGKKGPPLLPYVRVPAAAEITAARRVGSDVFLTISVPTMNIDESTPASIAEIEIYAVTAHSPPPSGLAFLPGATLVTTIPVARDADPSDRSGTVVADPETGALQGATATVRESLSAETLKVTVRPVPPARPTPSATPAVDASTAAQPLRRFYMTVPFSDRRRSGPPSNVVEVPLTSVPDRVPAVRATMAGHSIVVEWDPSGGLVGWLLDRPLAPEVVLADPPVAPTATAAPVPAAAAMAPPSGATLYNVYREIAPDPLVLPTRAAPPSPWASRPETPVNPQPLATLTFTEEVPFDDRRRCYRIRAVRGTGTQQVESEPSGRECIVPVDIEPPAQPTGLRATVLDTAVTLLWEPNGEEDFRGYVVLRREAGGDTLATLTSVPIAEPRYTDSSSVSGQMYRYLVHAVDNRIPLPNVSEAAEVAVTVP